MNDDQRNPQPRETDSRSESIRVAHPKSPPPGPEEAVVDIAHIYVPRCVESTFMRLTQHRLPARYQSTVRDFGYFPLDDEKAECYALKKNHAAAPPIDITRSYGGMYVLENGRHRFVAALCNRFTHIHARIHPGIQMPPPVLEDRRSEPELPAQECPRSPIRLPTTVLRPTTAYGGQRIGEASHPGPDYCDCKFGTECKHAAKHAHKVKGSPMTGKDRRAQEAAVAAGTATRGGGKPKYESCPHGVDCTDLACHAHEVAKAKTRARGAARDALVAEAVSNDNEKAAGEQDAHTAVAEEKEAAPEESSAVPREKKEEEIQVVVPSEAKAEVAVAKAASDTPVVFTTNVDLGVTFCPTLEAQMADAPSAYTITFGLDHEEEEEDEEDETEDEETDSDSDDEDPDHIAWMKQVEEENLVLERMEWLAIDEAHARAIQEREVAAREGHAEVMKQVHEYAALGAERKEKERLNEEHTARGVELAKAILADEDDVDPLAKSSVVVYRTGDRLTNSWIWEAFCEAIALVMPGLEMSDEYLLNTPAAMRVREVCSVENTHTRRLQWFGIPLSKKKKVKHIATLPQLYNLASRVEIFDKLYTVLMANPHLGSRRTLDGNGTLLPSLSAAAWQVVINDKGFKHWVKEPLIMQWTVMHFVNQRHHLGIVGASGMSEESFPQLFRRQGLPGRS